MKQKWVIAALAAMALGACSDGNREADAANQASAAAGNTADALVGAADTATSAIANQVDALGNAIDRRSVPTDDWVGRWNGVEGTYLVIVKTDTPGSYKMDMQYTLDDKGKFDGKAAGESIAFERPDGKQILRHTDGDQTGLKYLAGKKDCLSVKQGEGYCRD